MQKISAFGLTSLFLQNYNTNDIEKGVDEDSTKLFKGKANR